MLTVDDICALSELTDDEIAAIAHHEHIPEICAAEFGHYLVHSENGVPMLHRIILDDIEEAKRNGDTATLEHLRGVLRRFVAAHPELAAKRSTEEA
jgi:hypothetical protein